MFEEEHLLVSPDGYDALTEELHRMTKREEYTKRFFHSCLVSQYRSKIRWTGVLDGMRWKSVKVENESSI